MKVFVYGDYWVYLALVSVKMVIKRERNEKITKPRKIVVKILVIVYGKERP